MMRCRASPQHNAPHPVWMTLYSQLICLNVMPKSLSSRAAIVLLCIDYNCPSSNQHFPCTWLYLGGRPAGWRAGCLAGLEFVQLRRITRTSRRPTFITGKPGFSVTPKCTYKSAWISSVHRASNCNSVNSWWLGRQLVNCLSLHASLIHQAYVRCVSVQQAVCGLDLRP